MSTWIVVRKSEIKRKTPLRRTPFKKASTRKVTKASKIRRKKKVWSTKRADQTFSQFIRERDECCLRCRTRDNLTCSHYWKRGDSGTRFDPENCIALCVECHMDWEKRKNYEYREFMLDWLGTERYEALEVRARTYKNREEAVAEWKALYDQNRRK